MGKQLLAEEGEEVILVALLPRWRLVISIDHFQLMSIDPWPQALQQYKDMMTRAAMSPGGSSAAAAAAAMSAALGPNASAAMSALGPSASVAASMASMASGHQVGYILH